MKQIAHPVSMDETERSGPVQSDDLRNGMGREVGGGFRMGNTCIPMADPCECMAKTITIF